MKTTTYYAAKPFAIEGTVFVGGDVVGVGDITAGEFTPDKSCPVVEAGHVAARLFDGRITTAKPSKPDTTDEATQSPTVPKAAKPAK